MENGNAPAVSSPSVHDLIVECRKKNQGKIVEEYYALDIEAAL